MAKFSTCAICGKLVDIDQESHTLFHCRNFLLRSFYGEKTNTAARACRNASMP